MDKHFSYVRAKTRSHAEALTRKKWFSIQHCLFVFQNHCLFLNLTVELSNLALQTLKLFWPMKNVWSKFIWSPKVYSIVVEENVGFFSEILIGTPESKHLVKVSPEFGEALLMNYLGRKISKGINKNYIMVMLNFKKPFQRWWPMESTHWHTYLCMHL